MALDTVVGQLVVEAEAQVAGLIGEDDPDRTRRLRALLEPLDHFGSTIGRVGVRPTLGLFGSLGDHEQHVPLVQIAAGHDTLSWFDFRTSHD